MVSDMLPKELKLFFKIIDAKKQEKARNKFENEMYSMIRRGYLLEKPLLSSPRSQRRKGDEHSNQIEINVQPPNSSLHRNRRERGRTQNRIRSLLNHPQTVIDHRNNAWQNDSVVHPSLFYEEDKVEEIKQNSVVEPRTPIYNESRRINQRRRRNRNDYRTHELDEEELHLRSGVRHP
jgi:hypothetical protein